MERKLAWALLFSMAIACAGCSMGGGGNETPLAPQPAKAIDVAKFYTGRWYEIARTPMKLTDGCVAGTTDYFTKPNGQLIDRDACRDGTPEGKEEMYQGPVTILNPRQNTKVTVNYTVFGLFSAKRTYWMLDHGDDYGWFIVSDPAFKFISVFTRAPRPSAADVAQLTARAKSLGYDTSLLEYPTPFPAGEK
jgi:apolipoprotein D and lipocalin family protein